MRIVVLSDIHANLSALEAVIGDCTDRYDPDGIILPGDIVNYGMRPNEVIDVIKSFHTPVIASIYGNHEKALFDFDTDQFSTERGKRMLEYTRTIMTPDSKAYIQDNCIANGFIDLDIDGTKILVVHGSFTDPFWGKMTDVEMSDSRYFEYDYVISGHSHIPHLIEKFYEWDNPQYRNKKRTVFINPGSVGQPRNHNPKAQYACLDIANETIHFNSVGYDIATEQSLYPENLGSFYSERLAKGI